LHQLLEQGVTNWGIEEIDLVPSHTAEVAEKQDYLYTLCSKDPEGNREMTVIGCILGYTKGWEDKRKAIDLMKRPQTQLITLTITEKGYCYDNQTQSLDWQHPHLQHDLLDPRDPQSAVGYLALALSERCLQTKEKLTIASCDNIPSNGQVLKRCILQYCDRVFPSVVPWIEQYVAFPLSMVDRITPNTKAEDIQFVEREYGLRDDWLVVSEHFLQWVIEPEGLEGLPPFEKAGALVTKDVEAFETMKIRLLNGSHSALAYPALLLGYTFVDEALSDPLLHSFIRDCYMREVGETLLPIPGYDFEVYKDRLNASPIPTAATRCCVLPRTDPRNLPMRWFRHSRLLWKEVCLTRQWFVRSLSGPISYTKKNRWWMTKLLRRLLMPFPCWTLM